MAFQRFGISKFPGGECPRTPLDLCRHKCALVRYRVGSAPVPCNIKESDTTLTAAFEIIFYKDDRTVVDFQYRKNNNDT